MKDFWITDTSACLECGSPEVHSKDPGEILGTSVIHVREVIPGTITISREELNELFKRYNLHVPYNPEHWRMSLTDLEKELFK